LPESKVNAISDRSLTRFLQIFSDLRVRMGIKVALAAVLAYYVALWMRLENPTWALFTVMLVSLPQFVGAIAEKAALRTIGTTVGGLAGFLMVGNFVNEPWIIWPVTFLWVAFFSAMFMGTFYPYAFLLTGLTFIVVVTDSMLEPDTAWTVAKARIQEIIVGNLATVIVSSVLWPRYAVEEFRTTLKAGFRECAELYEASATFLQEKAGTPEDPGAIAVAFQSRLNSLRQLVAFGSRESSRFRSRLPAFQRAIDQIDCVFLAARTVGRLEFDARSMAEQLREEFREVVDSLADILNNLSDQDLPLTPPDFSRLDHAIEAVEDEIERRRDSGEITKTPITEIAAVCGMLFSLRDARTNLEKVAQLLSEDSRSNGTSAPGAYRNALLPPMSGIRAGIKGGIGTVVALIFCNWLNPPGLGLIPLTVWVCNVMSGMFYGGQGDRRAFQLASLVVLGGIPVVFLIFILNPLMSSYLVTNLVLLVLMFVYGFWAASIAGISWGLQVMILSVAGLMGLNQQEPVSVESVVNVYLGMGTGYLLGALVQRLIWPVLPQDQLRNRFVEFFDDCQELFQRDPGEDAPLARMRISLIPSELAGWIAQMTTPDVPRGEQARLSQFAEGLRSFGYHMRARRRPVKTEMPEDLRDRFQEMDRTLEAAYHDAAEGYRRAFAAGHAPEPSQPLTDALAKFSGFLQEVRQQRLLAGKSLGLTINFLGRLYNYGAIGRELESLGKEASQLKLAEYSGDNAL